MTSPARPMRYLVATDDGGSPHYVRCRQDGTALAASAGADLVLFDRSSESYLVDPYPVGAFADDADELGSSATLEPSTLRMLGRAYLADQVEEARAKGLTVHAHLAQGRGAHALFDAVARWQPSLLVLPGALARPSLVDRISGNTLDALMRGIDVEVRLVESD